MADRELLNAVQVRAQPPKAAFGHAPAHLPTLSGLLGALERGKVALRKLAFVKILIQGEKTKMRLSKYAKGTIAFLIAMVIGQIWSAVSPVYKSPWEPWPPIVPFMVAYVLPFLNDFYRPIMFALTGLVVLLVWENGKAGFVIAFLLAAVATGFGLSVTVFNTMNQEWSGLFTALTVVVFPSIMTLWYSFHGYSSHSSEA
jgi:hypothetical protein